MSKSPDQQPAANRSQKPKAGGPAKTRGEELSIMPSLPRISNGVPAGGDTPGQGGRLPPDRDLSPDERPVSAANRQQESQGWRRFGARDMPARSSSYA